VPYFLVTFTLPAGVREVARSQQEGVDNLFFRSSAEALQALALDLRFVGGRVPSGRGAVGCLTDKSYLATKTQKTHTRKPL
jgi:hypothetical protein